MKSLWDPGNAYTWAARPCLWKRTNYLGAVSNSTSLASGSGQVPGFRPRWSADSAFCGPVVAVRRPLRCGPAAHVRLPWKVVLEGPRAPRPGAGASGRAFSGQFPPSQWSDGMTRPKSPKKHNRPSPGSDSAWHCFERNPSNYLRARRRLCATIKQKERDGRVLSDKPCSRPA